MDYEGSRLIAITGLGSRLLLKPKENILPAGSIFEINKTAHVVVITEEIMRGH